jgi:hypothetical protein
MVVGVFAVVLAIWLPIKPLDHQVGPMAYKKMSLHDLTDHLRNDWGMRITSDSESMDIFLAFRTKKKMSQYQVLKKLAAETNLELNVGGCGTGANFLFGTHPMFISLSRPKVRAP